MPTEFKTSYVIHKFENTLNGQKLSVVLERARPIYMDPQPDGTVKVREGKESEFVVIHRNGRNIRFNMEEAEQIESMLILLSARQEALKPE